VDDRPGRRAGLSKLTSRLMSNWNFADVWEEVAAARPDSPAVTQGERRYTWADFDRRADGLASALLAAGLSHQSKVAQYLYNGPEYLESIFAAFKIGTVPVNTNYRYTEDELAYLWDNADVEAVVFHGSFSERAAAVRTKLEPIKCWLWVDDGAGACPEWAQPYEQAVAATPQGPVRAPWGRSGDDLILIYTGGTTGMPKGVMWRQDDLFCTLNRTGELRYREDGGIAGVRATLAAPSKYPPARLLPGPPLMHGTGLFTAMSVLNSAGSVILPESRHFDVEELLHTIEAERITEISIVGDAFAKPILAALDAEPDRWDISSLWLVISSGVMWSAEVKQGLLRHAPKLLMIDNLGSSEAIGMARSASKKGSAAATAGFELGPDTRVIGDDGRDVEPGSGRQGVVALRGRGPIGYYKDPDKSALTFKIINGERWTVPGDFALVEADGSVRLLGRGSVCINTGGEKVFPEEVEEVLKRHPAVHDAVVVGVPDARFGEAVAAVVELSGAGAPPPGTELSEWARLSLAGYKVPRHVITVETIGRAPNGKVDYKRLRSLAIDAVSAPS
jgi:acyl-CoA synthetase (AMP-forming)/AMP-acid ligase II